MGQLALSGGTGSMPLDQNASNQRGRAVRLRVKRVSEGPGPGEVLVEVETTSGIYEEVILHAKSIEGDTVEIGHPIAHVEEKSLVELPRESMSGRWRVWVPNSSVA